MIFGLLLVRGNAYAAHYTETCADAIAYSGYLNSSDCSAGTWTIPTPSGYGWFQFAALGFTPTYVSVNGSGTNHFRILDISFNTDVVPINTAIPVMTDVSLSGGFSQFAIYNDLGSGYQGTISSICFSDTLGECAGGTPTPPPPTILPFNSASSTCGYWATSTPAEVGSTTYLTIGGSNCYATSTMLEVNFTQFGIMAEFMAAFAGFALILWIFKKRI